MFCANQPIPALRYLKAHGADYLLLREAYMKQMRELYFIGTDDARKPQGRVLVPSGPAEETLHGQMLDLRLPLPIRGYHDGGPSLFIDGGWRAYQLHAHLLKGDGGYRLAKVSFGLESAEGRRSEIGVRNGLYRGRWIFSRGKAASGLVVLKRVRTETGMAWAI